MYQSYRPRWFETSGRRPPRVRDFSSGAGDREDEDIFSACVPQRTRAGRDGRARREYVVNEENLPAFDEPRSHDGERALDRLAPCARVHPGAVALAVRDEIGRASCRERSVDLG